MRCRVRGVEWRLECEVWSVRCGVEVWSERCRVRGVECEV